MTTIERIYALASEKGITMSSICRVIGKNRGYLNDIRIKNLSIAPDILEKIADYLGTTTDYLTGKTDKKNKPTTMGELDELDYEFIHLFHSAPEEARKSLLDLLRHL